MCDQDSTKQSQRGLRLLSGTTEEGIAIAEGECIIEVNVALTNILGYSTEELITMQLAQLVTPETWTNLKQSLDTETPPSIEGVGIRKDNSEVPLRIKGRIHHIDGKDLLVVLLADITMLKKAEDQLRQSEQRYRLLFNSMLDGFVLFEVINEEDSAVDCRVLDANTSFEQLVGRKCDELVGQSMKDDQGVFDINWLDLYSNVESKGEPVRFEKYSTDLDRYIEIVAFSPQLGKMATIIADITERKKLEARLRQAAKMEAIGTLASGVAHEINNPINVIMNYAGLMLRPNVKREDIETFAHEIVNESERIATIVRNLLTFARQEQEMHSPVNIRAIVDATLSLMKKVLDNDQISTEVDVPDDLPQVHCRRQQIEQVLVNLMTNARHALNQKYSGYNEDKRLLLSAKLDEVEGKRWVRTIIEDHGPGIPSDVIDRVFDPFFTTKTGSSGTGLGLSVSHGIVDDHRGRLTVESQLGEYTRFFLDLPEYDPDEDEPLITGRDSEIFS